MKHEKPIPGGSSKVQLQKLNDCFVADVRRCIEAIILADQTLKWLLSRP